MGSGDGEADRVLSRSCHRGRGAGGEELRRMRWEGKNNNSSSGAIPAGACSSRHKARRNIVCAFHSLPAGAPLGRTAAEGGRSRRPHRCCRCRRCCGLLSASCFMQSVARICCCCCCCWPRRPIIITAATYLVRAMSPPAWPRPAGRRRPRRPAMPASQEPRDRRLATCRPLW
jgi:hypothetical protein